MKSEATVWAALIVLAWVGAVYKTVHTIIMVRRGRRVRRAVLARLNGPRP